MNTHYPNPQTYRPLLGVSVNKAVILLAQKRNSTALQTLSVNEYLRKMIKHWWEQEFPDIPFPGVVKPYVEDLDFVQSVKT